jgi:hypothetical protein
LEGFVKARAFVEGNGCHQEDAGWAGRFEIGFKLRAVVFEEGFGVFDEDYAAGRQKGDGAQLVEDVGDLGLIGFRLGQAGHPLVFGEQGVKAFFGFFGDEEGVLAEDHAHRRC